MVGPKQLSFFPSLIQQPKKNKNNIQRTTTTTDKINRERLAMRIPSNREQIVMSLLSTSIYIFSLQQQPFFSLLVSSSSSLG